MPSGTILEPLIPVSSYLLRFTNYEPGSPRLLFSRFLPNFLLNYCFTARTAMHPISIQIITRDQTSNREVRHQYVIQSAHPRWDMLKVFLRAFFIIKFK
jgi:hypothetical protein